MPPVEGMQPHAWLFTEAFAGNRIAADFADTTITSGAAGSFGATSSSAAPETLGCGPIQTPRCVSMKTGFLPIGRKREPHAQETTPAAVPFDLQMDQNMICVKRRKRQKS